MPTPLHVLEAIADAREASDDLKEYDNEHKRVVDRHNELKANADALMDAAKVAIVANHEVIDTDVVDGFRLTYPVVIDIGKLIEMCPDVADMDIVKTTVTKKDYDALVKNGDVTTRQQLEIEGKAETPTIRKPKW